MLQPPNFKWFFLQLLHLFSSNVSLYTYHLLSSDTCHAKTKIDPTNTPGSNLRRSSHLREGGKFRPAGVCGEPGRQHAQVHRLGTQRTGRAIITSQKRNTYQKMTIISSQLQCTHCAPQQHLKKKGM
jgi:hypothetical protein